MNPFKFIGCVLLTISCMIGAGILALPIIANKFGLGLTYFFMTIAYITMLSSGLLILEICLKLPAYKNNFSSIAENAFGKAGRYVIMLIIATILYTVITAYISASPAIFTNTFLPNLTIPFKGLLLSFIFTTLLGLIIIIGIKYADFLNRFIMSFKLLILVSVITLLFIYTPISTNFEFKTPYGFSEGFSVIILVFSYQTIIPSLVNYIGKGNSSYTKWVIITATTITFIISLLWTTAIVNIITQYHIDPSQALSLSGLLNIINQYNSSPVISIFLMIFFNITLISSFIALSVAFIDIWLDLLKLNNNFCNRLICGLIVYIPCWVIANFDKNIFIHASAISGYCGLFGVLLFPSIVSYKHYNKDELQFIPGKSIRGLMIAISLIIISSIALFSF